MPVFEHVGDVEVGAGVVQGDGVVGADFADLREDGLDWDGVSCGGGSWANRAGARAH